MPIETYWAILFRENHDYWFPVVTDALVHIKCQSISNNTWEVQCNQGLGHWSVDGLTNIKCQLNTPPPKRCKQKNLTWICQPHHMVCQGLVLFNNDTRPSGHISRPIQVNVSQSCFNSLNKLLKLNYIVQVWRLVRDHYNGVVYWECSWLIFYQVGPIRRFMLTHIRLLLHTMCLHSAKFPFSFRAPPRWPPVFLSADWFAGWIYVWFSCWKAGFFFAKIVQLDFCSEVSTCCVSFFADFYHICLIHGLFQGREFFF